MKVKKIEPQEKKCFSYKKKVYAKDFRTVLVDFPLNIYVDDATVIYSAEDIETLCDDLNEELTNISEWMQSNKLSHNVSKSEFLIMGHKRQLNVSNNRCN